jgi:hypothetical protein
VRKKEKKIYNVFAFMKFGRASCGGGGGAAALLAAAGILLA